MGEVTWEEEAISKKKEPGTFRGMFGLLGEALGIGIAVIGSILAGLAFGYFLDNKVFDGRTYPWLTTIFLILGAIGGFKNLFVMTKRRFKE